MDTSDITDVAKLDDPALIRLWARSRFDLLTLKRGTAEYERARASYRATVAEYYKRLKKGQEPWS